MKSADKTDLYIELSEHIAEVVNACYTRDTTGMLVPLFRVPYRNDRAVRDYQARYEIAQKHLSTAEKEAMK